MRPSIAAGRSMHCENSEPVDGDDENQKEALKLECVKSRRKFSNEKESAYCAQRR